MASGVLAGEADAARVAAAGLADPVVVVDLADPADAGRAVLKAFR